MTRVSRPQFESIVEAGIWAPSADNRHPVEFELLESGIALWGTPAFGKAPFHRRVLGLIGFGAVAENMMVRASKFGLAAEIAWFPDIDRPQLVARIDLSSNAGRADDLDAAIPLRHTNRRFFRGPPMREPERRAIEAEAARIPGVRLLWFDGPEQRRRMLRLMLLAESERFRSKALHEELFSSIRFDVGWTATADEGLPPGALGIEPALRWAFRALRRWPLMRVLNGVGAHYLIGARGAYAPCHTAPHLCVLVTTLPLRSGCLAVGRALERAWLRATALGFEFQPFAAPALLALEDYGEVRPSIRHNLRKRWSELVSTGTPLIAFRIGRGASPPVRSGRLPAGEYCRPRHVPAA
jgi:hypothetical protein